MYGFMGQPHANEMSAATSASRTLSAAVFCSSNQLAAIGGRHILVRGACVYDSKRYPTCHPANLNGSASCCAKYKDSGSFANTTKRNDAGSPLVSRDDLIAVRSSSVSVRHEAIAFIFSVSRFASAAARSATEIFSSDSRFSRRVSTIARRIQTISIMRPAPTAASAMSMAAISQFDSVGFWKWIVSHASRAIPTKMIAAALADQRSSDSSAAVGFFFAAAFDEKWLRKRLTQLFILCAIAVIFLVIEAWLHWS